MTVYRIDLLYKVVSVQLAEFIDERHFKVTPKQRIEWENNIVNQIQEDLNVTFYDSMPIDIG